MTLLGITPGENKTQRRTIKRIARSNSLVFTLLFVATPFIAYGILQLGVYLGWWAGDAQKNQQIKSPVALVSTSKGSGTAFLVSETKLLTAAHVVANEKIGDQVQLTFKGVKPEKVATAKVIFKGNNGKIGKMADFAQDVAVLELTTPITDIAPLELGDSESVTEQDKVLMVGYPFGGDLTLGPGSITSNSFQNVQELFKHNTPSNPGDSGGPLVLENDKTVIGVVPGGLASFKDASGRLIVPQGENNAIKIHEVINYLNNSGIDIYK